ncbi:MAG TPA: hypothetical protein VHP83_27600, partial [Aggregatilineaceae bacterium]|nr:hypothetical protein [Aggregatilineaceae bacterium]
MKRYLIGMVCLVLLLPGAVFAQGGDADTDGDGIVDPYDACPNEAGLQENYGCPTGAVPPDVDGDGTLDLYDRCPNDAGPNGLDCPDSDGDQVIDHDDVCPDELGEPGLYGCLSVKQISLPAALAPLTAENIGQTIELGHLVLNVSQIALGQNGILVIQKYGYTDPGMAIYDLNQSPLAQTAMLESQGGLIGMSADGAVVVDTFYSMDGAYPTLTVWDVSTGTGLHYIEVPEDHSIVQVAVNANGSQFATADGIDGMFGPPLDQYNVRLWDTASGSLVTLWSLTTPVSQLAFSPDGTKLAVGAGEGVIVYDVATLLEAARLDVVPATAGSAMVFSPDGTRLTVGQAGGVLSVWDMTTLSKLYDITLFTATEWDSARSAAWSPDGTLIAVGGGPYVEGRMNFTPEQHGA